VDFPARGSELPYGKFGGSRWPNHQHHSASKWIPHTMRTLAPAKTS
jgi:hypothetical protein